MRRSTLGKYRPGEGRTSAIKAARRQPPKWYKVSLSNVCISVSQDKLSCQRRLFLSRANFLYKSMYFFGALDGCFGPTHSADQQVQIAEKYSKIIGNMSDDDDSPTEKKKKKKNLIASAHINSNWQYFSCALLIFVSFVIISFFFCVCVCLTISLGCR